MPDVSSETDYPIRDLIDATGDGWGAPFGRSTNDQFIYHTLQQAFRQSEEMLSEGADLPLIIARPIMPAPAKEAYDAGGHYWGVGDQVWQVNLYWEFNDPAAISLDELDLSVTEVNGKPVVPAHFYMRGYKDEVADEIHKRRSYVNGSYVNEFSPVVRIWNDVESYSYERAKEAILNKENVLV